MCTYINKGNEGFKSAVKGTYIDKTGMIAVINQTLDTERRFTCVTRGRRFGKSMAADMLCAYYDKSCDSRLLFEGLFISMPNKEVNGIVEDKQYEKNLNKYPVISLDITDFTTKKPGKLASFFGFLPNEVEALAKKYSFPIDELKEWYDGYRIGDESSIYNPYSVIEAIESGKCSSCWSTTGAYDSVVTYINRNFNGLKDDIIMMLAGGRCRVNTTKFQNDLSIINSKDDVLTVLIHLGYLSFNPDKSECYIPNKEVRIEMTNAVEATGWKRLNEALAASEKLLADTLEGREEAVAQGIELAHDDNTSILSYNDENSLACVLSIAYYFAKNDYVWHREMPTGKGFADIVLIPRKNIDSPAIVLELKYDKDADTAINQIHCKNYPSKILDYTGEILLVGINYAKNGPKGKKHTCKIERLVK